MRVRLGNEAFLEDPAAIAGAARVGLIANQTSFTPDMRSVVHALAASKSPRLTAILAPEHGLFGAAQDMEAVPGGVWEGIPVFSLYGETEASLAPPADAMELVDALVFDVQDVGSRYYTFIWTLAYAMTACAEAGKTMIVLDRPNPLSGLVVSGPTIQAGYRSFVGRYPMPIRHGLTAGEVARWLVRTHGIDADLRVVEMGGWRRAMMFDDTGLPWIPPSPNMPSVETAFVYPGACLIEGTTLSEGRGTTTPFELAGAPAVSPEMIARRLGDFALPGVRFRPTHFRPMYQKHAGDVCGGVFVHVTDRGRFDAIAAYVRLIATVRELFPHAFDWRKETYEFVDDRPAIDLLWGDGGLRRAIDDGAPLDGLFARAARDAEAFADEREDALRYV
ncbi:DUF1343 domain-containing protein [bacterium]|nr:DUF1343 domain-containing protein [bacterium]